MCLHDLVFLTLQNVGICQLMPILYKSEALKRRLKSKARILGWGCLKDWISTSMTYLTVKVPL